MVMVVPSVTIPFLLSNPLDVLLGSTTGRLAAGGTGMATLLEKPGMTGAAELSVGDISMFNPNNRAIVLSAFIR
jgi:hypothetical protein